jgi:hypothetical protein
MLSECVGLPIRVDSGVYGTPFMKFTLTFDGDLPSNGRPKEKWQIRNQFHPQLAELWRINPCLQEVVHRRHVSTKGYMQYEIHHSQPEFRDAYQPDLDGNSVDLLEPILRGSRQCLPLISERLGLKCGLHIAFLRRDEPGNVYQHGDLDNRLKTLFDALQVPNPDQMAGEPTLEEIPNPIYCLLEDDKLITGFQIESHQLLSRSPQSKNDVSMIIHVDVRVIRPRLYNQMFLGG